MAQQQESSTLARVVLQLTVGIALTACGGGDGNEPVSVGASVVSYDISGVVDSQRKALSAAGAEVTWTKCYPGVKLSSGQITEDRVPAVLYVHQVRMRDLDGAAALGFKSDYLTTGFSQIERACSTDPDTPANDIAPDDTPANPG